MSVFHLEAFFNIKLCSFLNITTTCDIIIYIHSYNPDCNSHMSTKSIREHVFPKVTIYFNLHFHFRNLSFSINFERTNFSKIVMLDVFGVFVCYHASSFR